ncbi:CU044_5270 family protein [Streptosporangium sp. NBC_01756]|uniref:CU044_5270 family protein n=1 Tax=Streptosporangium sp. NBC_01756 TaxID=2975950 RepID=UPI002DD8C6D4|nr:CU044_5270 family protein [Streptosporangium sp. NBC_01756]WSC84657.1 CU044_5270 family protein [Streptosporangium sp. NBC_01756]
MDELEKVRELYGEPPADPLLETRVRRRLETEFRRRRRLPWTVAVTGLAAAATAVAIAFPGMTGETGPPDRATEISGRSILLTAATRAESDPATAHGYWRVRKLHRRTYPEPLGRGGNRYRVVESRLTEQWVAADGRMWAGSRTLGARPESPADTEAWRRDGSPTEWADRQLSTAPGKGLLNAVTGRAPFSMAGHEMGIGEIQGLPADPAALKNRVAEVVRDVPAGSVDGVVADALSGLLWSKPSPPDVRAAAYRALAELPNVRYLGTTTDERGRAGAAFSFTVRTTATVQRTLIIDPASSRVLSSTDTGGPGTAGEKVEVVLEAGWTDDEPAAPELP